MNEIMRLLLLLSALFTALATAVPGARAVANPASEISAPARVGSIRLAPALTVPRRGVMRAVLDTGTVARIAAPLATIPLYTGRLRI
jgi:hypothetical protein